MKISWQDIQKKVLLFLSRVLPTRADDEPARLFKRTAFTITGMVLFFGFFAVSTFFLVLRGQEETMVPDLLGQELANALLDLQEKELYPRLQLRYSSDPREKGRVIGQDPPGGLLVKAGQRVTLTVSQGAIVDRVEDYVGQTLADVRITLQTLFATTTPLLRIRDNPTYVYSDAPPGTILEQSPEPGTTLTTLTDLVFVISRGPRGQTVPTPGYLGRPYAEALSELIRAGTPFAFKARPAGSGETPGQIVAQSPNPGIQSPKNTVLNLILANPRPVSGQVFGVFEYSLPEYPILVDMKLEVREQDGDRRVLAEFAHPGGLIGIPYTAQVGDSLVLSIFGKDLITQPVLGN